MNEVNVAIRMDTLEALWATRKNDNEAISDLIYRALKIEIGRAPAARASKFIGVENLGPFQYGLFGEKRTAQNAGAALIDIIETISEREPNLLNRLAPLVRGTSRNHISNRRDQVYPKRPDLINYVKELSSGWYIGTNIANREKRYIVEAACKVSGLKFGTDVIYKL